MFAVDNKLFTTYEQAEQYTELIEDVMSRTYYDVLFNPGHDVSHEIYTARVLIGVEGKPSAENPFPGLAWIPEILGNSEHIDSYYYTEEWKVIEQYNVTSLDELLNLASDTPMFSNYHNASEEDTDILLTQKNFNRYKVLHIPTGVEQYQQE